MGLQQFERRLERLVEGAFARAFRGELQPVEIGRRLTREMDLLRKVGVHGIIAPNSFEVALSPHDLDQFEGFADALARELAEAAREHARSEGYVFLGPVKVDLYEDTSVPRSTVVVNAAVAEGRAGVPAALLLPDGRRIRMDEEPITIGRLPGCSIVLADPNVSRKHAELRRQGSEVLIVDLESTNGTKVNGKRITQRRLADGDEITVGTTALHFEAS